jgi:hypothetical protein
MKYPRTNPDDCLNHKLTQVEKELLTEMFWGGCLQVDLCRLFGISKTGIRYILFPHVRKYVLNYRRQYDKRNIEKTRARCRKNAKKVYRRKKKLFGKVYTDYLNKWNKQQRGIGNDREN